VFSHLNSGHVICAVLITMNIVRVCSAEALVSIPMKSEIPLNYMIVEVKISSLLVESCIVDE